MVWPEEIFGPRPCCYGCGDELDEYAIYCSPACENAYCEYDTYSEYDTYPNSESDQENQLFLTPEEEFENELDEIEQWYFASMNNPLLEGG